MKHSWIVALLIALLCSVNVSAADVEVPLVVKERAGVARIGNHVNSGVPLPLGAVQDAGELAVFTADGKPVNAQITERCRWLKDKSLKFVTVHFLCDVPAKGTAGYVLKKTARSRGPAPTVQVKGAGDRIVVDTGAVQFALQKSPFSLFESVQVKGKDVVRPGTAKIHLVATDGEYKVSGKIARVARETEASDPAARVTEFVLEEKGPVRAVVKVAGEFVTADKKALDFVARYYALAGSPSVRVVLSVVNRSGSKFEAFAGVRELGLVVPLASFGALEYAFGTKDENDITGKLESGDARATLLQLKSSGFTVNAKEHPGGKNALSRRLGWVSARCGDTRVSAGVRYFWQLYPKGLEVAGDGTLKVMLVAPGESASRAGASGVPFFTGAARTHEVLFCFGGGKEQAMGVIDPLFAQAPSAWYCQQTGGFGQFYDANPGNFKPEHRDLVAKFQSGLESSFKSVLGRKKGTQGMEEYGFFNWGAGIHHSSVVKGTWLDTGWNGNYYDFPFACMVNFIRTGNPVYWDIAQAHALHIADVDVCHWHPKNRKLNGIEHVCYSIGHFRQFWRSEPFGVSGNADSTKNQSLYHCYYMTGDRWYLDVALLVSDYNAVHGGGALRARGNRMTGLFGSYQATHDPKHLERWKNFVYKQGIGLAKSRGIKRWDQEWMYGLAAEGLMTYYRTTGDLQAAEAVRTCADSLIATYWDANRKATKTLHGFSLIAFGYAYELTGDTKYLEMGLGQLAAVGGGSRTKSFAQQFRLSPQFLQYLAADYKPPKPVLTEKRVFEPPKPKPPKPAPAKVSAGKGALPVTRDLRIMCHPSEAEYNGGAATLLRVRNANSKSGELPILDFDGAAVKRFLAANQGKKVTATLSMKVRRIQNGPAVLRVVPLHSTVDWQEGTQVQEKASKGSACYAWARHGVKKWTNAAGEEVADVRATFYDRKQRKLLVKENSKTFEVKSGMSSVDIMLDDWLVRDLAENPNNRGLIVFATQDVDGKQAIIDVHSRSTRSGPVLHLTTPDAGRAPLPKPTIKGKTALFKAHRDARITCHPSEETLNSGRATRLRVKNANSKSCELSLVDFNTDAMKAFLAQNKGKKITGILILKALQLQNCPARLQVTALQSASDWREGTGVMSAPKAGECSYKWAQHSVARWKKPGGSEVPDVRALFYDKLGQKATLKVNSAAVEIQSGMKTIKVPLDDWLVKDLAENPNNRGLALFVTQPMDVKKAILDFKSKEMRDGPVIELRVEE